MIELPNYYACTGCGETFNFTSRSAYYCFDVEAVSPGTKLSGSKIFAIPVRPAWCKDCSSVCLVENLLPVRSFEDAYGMTKAGKEIEYPFASDHLSAPEAEEIARAYLQWRMRRSHRPRALCCGRVNYQFLDVEQPLLKHEECDFGVVEPRYTFSSYNGPGPGVYSPANLRLYNGEGELIGLLTWRQRGSDVWEVAATEYPATDVE